MVKYKLEYRDFFNKLWVLDIDIAGYSGNVISVTGTGDNAVDIIRELDNADDLLSNLVHTSLEINIYNQSNIDVGELRDLGSRDARVYLYRSGQLRFSGYLVPDDISEDLSAFPQTVSLKATDGLKMLDSISYSTGNQSLPNGIPNKRSPIRAIYEMFQQSYTFGINNELPVSWINSLKTKYKQFGSDPAPFDADMLSYSEYGIVDGALADNGGNQKTGMDTMIGLLKTINARLYQEDGKWNIVRINDLVKDMGVGGYLDLVAFTYNNQAIVYPVRTIGDESDDFIFVDENVNRGSLYGLSKATVNYGKTQFRNIVPNGSMNSVNSIFNVPIYWSVLKKSGVLGNLTSSIPLSLGGGSSAKITRLSTPMVAEPIIFSHTTSNIDVKNININNNGGYKELEFGFTYMFEQAHTTGHSAGGQKIADVNINNGTPVHLSFPLRFSLGFHMDNKWYFLNEFGTWTEDTSIDYLGGIGLSANLDNKEIRLLDAVSVNMNKYTVKIPELPSGGSNSVISGMYVYFNVYNSSPNGTVVLIDDVYINVQDSEESYFARDTSQLKRTVEEDFEMSISSSENSFFLSNVMSNYYKARAEENYITDDGYVGNLTQVYAKSIMDLRGGKSRSIIDTTIHGDGYRFGQKYDILGERCIELASRHKTVTGNVDISLINIEDNGVQSFVQKVEKETSKPNSDVWI